MLRVFDLTNKQEWRRIINSGYQYDFYHTYNYHYLANQNGEGNPKLFVYTKDSEYIALPLLERIIDKKRNLKDYTSVYGYVGPICSNKNISKSCLVGFRTDLKSFMAKNNVVSVFSRLHPLIDQDEILKDLGDVENLSKTVTVELELTLDEQRRKYRKSNKSEINKLRRTVICKKANTDEELDKYIAIYIDNMKRINAAERYLFDKDYFINLLNSEDYYSEIVLAYENSDLMAGAMFVYSKNIIQYHLAGTTEKYLSKTPMKLILDWVRIKGTEEGFKYFHLGGGVGSKEDSLLRFKAGFSDRYDQFKVWKYIVQSDVYNELVNSRKEKIADNNYFPLYRG